MQGVRLVMQRVRIASQAAREKYREHSLLVSSEGAPDTERDDQMREIARCEYYDVAPAAAGAGRPIPGKQQSTGQTSWLGPRSPIARFCANPLVRSTTSS
jgi:hypothetical protein